MAFHPEDQPRYAEFLPCAIWELEHMLRRLQDETDPWPYTAWREEGWDGGKTHAERQAIVVRQVSAELDWSLAELARIGGAK